MNKKQKSVLEKKSFYTALCIILIAVASVSWAASDRAKIRNQANDITSSIEEPVTSEPKEIANPTEKTVSDVPYESEKTSQQEDEQEEHPEVESSVPEDKPQKQASYFIMPVGGSVYKGFDDQNLQYSETYKDWRVHLGIDIAAKIGTAVFSSGDGVVKEISEDATMGTVVKIDHGSGIMGYYCGLNKIPTVSEGQTVEAGTQIGAVDVIPCESVEQAHLHFAMSRDEKWIDPNEYISVE